jgi:hypothetical protein
MSGNLGEPLGALRAGGFDPTTPAVDPLHYPTGGLLIEAGFGAIDLSGHATIANLTITERMGTPDTANIELVDLDGSLTIAVLANLVDLHIATATHHLFRGQVTTSVITSIDGVASTMVLTAEGYERLIAGAPVAFPPPDQYIEQPDGTMVNTYGASTSGASDKVNVKVLFDLWWRSGWANVGPPVDAETMVVETTSNPGHYWAPLDRIMLDAAFALVAETTGAADHLVWWLDAELRFHWIDGAAGTEPAPYAINANGFISGAIMPTKISITREAGAIPGGAYVTGALPWVGGPYPSSAGWAPWVAIQSDRAQTVAYADAFAARYFAETGWPKISGKATIPPGYDGWHKGQTLPVTDPATGLNAIGLLIQGVVARLISPGDDPPSFEHDLDFGDAPHRSLGRETALPVPPPPTVQATSYTVTSDDPNPTPTKPANLKAQLKDFKGDSLGTKGITGVWNLNINGTRVADPTDSSQSFWLDSASGTTDETGAVFNVEHVSATAGLDYADPFFETVQP